MPLWANFFKPEKNLEFFRLKNWPRVTILVSLSEIIFGIILDGPVIVIVSWAIENNLVYF